MKSILGYYNGNSYVSMDSVDVKLNQKVIITFLDEVPKKRMPISLEKLESYCSDTIASVPNGMDAQQYISALRKDREL